MTWQSAIVFGLCLGGALGFNWACNAFWSRYLKRVLEDAHEERTKLIDRHYERSTALLDAWNDSIAKLNDAWDDRVRAAFGQPPRKVAEVVKLPESEAGPERGE